MHENVGMTFLWVKCNTPKGRVLGKILRLSTSTQ